MVLPTYLDIEEAVKRIQKKIGEPATPGWLLQYAAEGRLQLFALVRDDDICEIAKPHIDIPADINVETLSPMAKARIIEFDDVIRIVHPVGSRIPLAKKWAARIFAEKKIYIKKITVSGREQAVMRRVRSNFTLHQDGRITGWEIPWIVEMNDLCFLSADIDRLIDGAINTTEKAGYAITAGKTTTQTESAATPGVKVSAPGAKVEAAPGAKVEAAPVKSKSTPATSAAYWKDEARAIADELFDRDTKNGCRDSLNGYSGRVMEAMQERGVTGPRGIIDNAKTVMRDALQGKKWWANKSK